mmetsp:Transcript_5528/g.16299  ORF Transcript_5528/g.16299 Transcript_5528/m.16299 type:complete len:201 (+) Transcript_5528:378-980(+)
MSVLGAERQNWISPILARSMRVGPPAAFLAPCAKTMPLTSSVSSTVPPTCFTIFIVFKSTVVAVTASTTLRTASTASGASLSEFCEITLDERHVVTASTSRSRSPSLTGCAHSLRISSHAFAASTNASAIEVGWSPLTRSWWHASRSDPAITHTEVVPSPASMSCDLLSSTSILAVGCATSICDRIVAPSLVIRTSPSAV